jgi:polar amino acid transport system substrate-binding protein
MRSFSGYLVFFTVIFTILLPLPIFAHEDVKTVTLGIVVFPPLVIKDSETGRCYGEVVEMSSKLLKQFGYNMNIECIPPIRLFERVKQGEIDLTVNVKGTAALDDHATFVHKPVTNLKLMRITNNERLNEKSIAGIRGYDYVGERTRLVDEGYEFVDMPSSVDSIKLFLFDRTASLITYERPFHYFLGEREFNEETTSITLKRNIPTFFAVSSKSKYKEDLIERLSFYSESFNEETFLEHTSAPTPHL